MNSEDLKKRFIKFAIDVALLIKELPKKRNTECRIQN